MMLALIETAVVDRLAATGVKAIAATAVDSVEKIKAPAYVVVFDGLSVKSESSARDAVFADASWLVVAIARNAVRPQEGRDARHDVLGMLQTAFSLLSGWQPDGAMRALRFAGADGVEFEPPVAMLPLRFSCEVKLMKE